MKRGAMNIINNFLLMAHNLNFWIEGANIFHWPQFLTGAHVIDPKTKKPKSTSSKFDLRV